MPYKGSTVRIRNVMKDFDDSPLTPESQEVKIYDPEGTLKETITSPTLESTGIYYMDYTIPSDGKEGNWKVIWTATKGVKPHLDVFTFSVSTP